MGQNRITKAIGRKASARKTPVTPKALLARINRRLAHEDAQLWKTPPSADREALGRWHITRSGEIDRTHVDPVLLATGLKLIKGWERIDDPTGHLSRQAPAADDEKSD